MNARFAGILVWAAIFAGRPLAAELAVSTDFEGGSGRVLELRAEAQEIRIAPAGDESRGMPNWWFVRIDGINTTKPVVLEVVARAVGTPDNLRVKWTPLNPGWTLPTCAAVSTDGKNWQQTTPADRDRDRATYRVRTDSPTLWLAWGPPFTPGDAERFVTAMTVTHPFVEGFALATSREGRAVPALRIGEGETPAAQRPAVFVTARQHAWECGGSWVGVGLAEWLASDDGPAQWLRRHAEFFFVPVMDVDHVATGDGGKHAAPQDHNRDWSDEPHWPEVAAAQQRLRELAREDRLAVFLDLHNPSQGARVQTFFVQYPPYVSDAAAAATEQFLAKARAVFGDVRLLNGNPSVPEHLSVWKTIAAPWVNLNGNADTVSLTVETPWNTPQGTPAGYREVGRKLGVALAQYLQSRADTTR